MLDLVMTIIALVQTVCDEQHLSVGSIPQNYKNPLKLCKHIATMSQFLSLTNINAQFVTFV
jgi:hypothetical protein